MKKASFYILVLLFISCGMFCSQANADWINLSGAQNAPNIAEIHINDDNVKIELEIFVRDLVIFDRLIPDEFFAKADIKRASLDERLRQFSSEDLQVINNPGQKLQAHLRLIEPRLREERPMAVPWKINPYTGHPIPGPPQDKRVLYAELIYPFKQRPKSLTLIPPLDEQSKIPKASIGFITYHKGAPLHDFRYLSEPSTVTLDWQDPWYSVFDNKALQRWQRGGVMSFLYIEPYEVRHEILARVKDLAAWIDLGLRGDEFIEADENDPLKKRVGEFFKTRPDPDRWQKVAVDLGPRLLCQVRDHRVHLRCPARKAADQHRHGGRHHHLFNQRSARAGDQPMGSMVREYPEDPDQCHRSGRRFALLRHTG